MKLVRVNVGPLLIGVIDEIRPSQSCMSETLPVLGYPNPYEAPSGRRRNFSVTRSSPASVRSRPTAPVVTFHALA